MTPRNIAIIHYNTPELTEAAVMSVRKHGGANYRITILDNSDRRPFTREMENVTVIDNTRGQVINFENELAKYPDREPRYAMQSNYGSFKHIISVQKLWELIPEGFVLMESDVLLKKNIDFMFNEDECCVGHIQSGAGNHHNIERLVPFLCYINVPKCVEKGAVYFDPLRCWALQKGVETRGNWYDTGAAFLEDIRSHRNGMHGLRIDIRPLIAHYHGGSWKNDLKSQVAWLRANRSLWSLPGQGIMIHQEEMSPRPESKDVAVCIIVRCENPYLQEWMEHYLKIGVKKVFLYDNSQEGDERPVEVLSQYVESGQLEIIDYTAIREGAQCKSYIDCYMRHNKEYGWIGFLDADELVRVEGDDLPAYLNSFATDVDVVSLSWRIMTDSGLTRYDSRPMSERFTVAKTIPSLPDGKEFVKSFIRGGIFGLSFRLQPHVPSRAGKLNIVNAIGQQIPVYPAAKPVHERAWVDHYLTKTAEEYRGKIARGFINVSQLHHDSRIRTAIEDFYNINERTPEKDAILNGETLQPEKPTPKPEKPQSEKPTPTPQPEKPEPAKTKKKNSKPKTKKHEKEKRENARD